MDDAVRVGEGNRLTDPQEQPQAIGERRVVGLLIEPDTANQLHDVIDPPIRKAAHVVHRHDARVLEPGQDPGLPAEPGHRVVITGTGAKDLERYLAGQLAIHRAKHPAHPSLSDQLLELIAGTGEVRPLGDPAQVFQGPVGQPVHATSRPSSSFASARNSRSLPQR